MLLMKVHSSEGQTLRGVSLVGMVLGHAPPQSYLYPSNDIYGGTRLVFFRVFGYKDTQGWTRSDAIIVVALDKRVGDFEQVVITGDLGVSHVSRGLRDLVMLRWRKTRDVWSVASVRYTSTVPTSVQHWFSIGLFQGLTGEAPVSAAFESRFSWSYENAYPPTSSLGVSTDDRLLDYALRSALGYPSVSLTFGDDVVRSQVSPILSHLEGQGCRVGRSNYSATITSSVSSAFETFVLHICSSTVFV